MFADPKACTCHLATPRVQIESLRRGSLGDCHVLGTTDAPHPPAHPPPAPPPLAEYRISVYGRKPVEWDTLAAWVVQNRLYSDNNAWLIQVGVQVRVCARVRACRGGVWRGRVGGWMGPLVISWRVTHSFQQTC